MEVLNTNNNTNNNKSKRKKKQIRCASVDNYQGEENDIIILDLVRCNPNHIIGFLKEFQRMNVALSRAKTGMIIIGSKETLNVNDNWDKFFDMLEESGSMTSCFNA